MSKVILLLVLFLSPLLAKNFEYIVQEKLLQTRMKAEFPIVKESLFISYEVRDPKLSLDGKKQRFNIRAKLTITNIQTEDGKHPSAIVALSSRIAYSKGGKLYLRKIKVLDIKSTYISADMKSMLVPSVQEALNAYFKTRPIYSLKDEKGMIGTAVNSIENVIIVKEGLKVVFKLG